MSAAITTVATLGILGFMGYYLYNKFFPGQNINQIIQNIMSKIPTPPTAGGIPTAAAGGSPNANIIGIAGDWDKGSQTSKTVANMQKHNVGFVIGTGDYAYSGSGSAWVNGVMAPFKGRIKGAIGNHDSNSYLAAFGQTKWTFMQPINRNLAVVFIDTEAPSTSKEMESAMMQAKVAGYRNIVCALHKPVMDSSGAHHKRDEGKVMGSLRPLLTKYGVKAVFQGHNHDFHHMFVGGVHYVTVGTGGRKLRKNPGGAPGERKVINGTFGFLKVTIGANLTCQFISNSTGSAIYSFVI